MHQKEQGVLIYVFIDYFYYHFLLEPKFEKMVQHGLAGQSQLRIRYHLHNLHHHQHISHNSSPCDLTLNLRKEIHPVTYQLLKLDTTNKMPYFILHCAANTWVLINSPQETLIYVLHSPVASLLATF